MNEQWSFAIGVHTCAKEHVYSNVKRKYNYDCQLSNWKESIIYIIIMNLLSDIQVFC